jgi:hypothetical protein
MHMLDVIEAVGQEAKTSEASQQLLRHVSLIQAESQAGALVENDRQVISSRCEVLQEKLMAA